MTEAEWLGCADPTPMLEFLRGKASDRKLRLFAVACCRRVWHLLPDDAGWKAVDLAEGFAEGLLGVQSLRQGEEAAAYYQDNPDDLTQDGVDYLAAGAVFQLCQESFRPEDVAAAAYDTILRFERIAVSNAGAVQASHPPEPLVQGRLLYCVFGNPFDPSPHLAPAVLAWNDRTIPHLAQGIYEDRKMPEGTFDLARLAILADALLDAGCDDDDLIQHCRSPGPHVRGCWAVDLCLGLS